MINMVNKKRVIVLVLTTFFCTVLPYLPKTGGPEDPRFANIDTEFKSHMKFWRDQAYKHLPWEEPTFRSDFVNAMLAQYQTDYRTCAILHELIAESDKKFSPGSAVRHRKDASTNFARQAYIEAQNGRPIYALYYLYKAQPECGEVCDDFIRLLENIPLDAASVTDKDKALGVLGLDADVTKEQIRKAFHELSLRYHPDKNPNPEAQKHYEAIVNAYEYLTRS